ncbi:MAG: Cell division trigger factor, partial [uncultured Quadrisphaera sp.]
MKSAVETLNPTRVKLTVEVPLDELKPSLDAAYRTIGGQIQVPGFRKGKVPPRIIDQRVGRGAVLQEAINEALPGFYRQAVTETDVRPLGQPQVEVTAVPEDAGSQLEFTAEVDVRPTIELPDFSTLAVTVDDVEVTDEDVQTRLEALRQRFGTLAAVERPAEAGDVLSLDLTARIGDEEIETVTGHTYEIGSGQLLEGVDEAVTGAAKGETRTFTTLLAGGDHAGEEADVTVTVASVKVRELPDADDEFAQLASEFDTLDELLADLRSRAEQEAEFKQGVQARDKVLEALLESVEVPVPESLVEAEVHQHLENESRLEDDEHRAEVDVEARKALRAQLLLDTIVDRDQVRVDQGELVEYIVAQAPRYGMDAQSFAKAMEQSGQLPQVLAEVARRKALSTVLEQAVVTDASGRPVVLTDDEDEDAEATDGAVVEGASVPEEPGVVGEQLDDAPAPAAAEPKAASEPEPTASAEPALADPQAAPKAADPSAASPATETTDVAEQAGGGDPVVPQEASEAAPAPAPKRTR